MKKLLLTTCMALTLSAKSFYAESGCLDLMDSKFSKIETFILTGLLTVSSKKQESAK